MNNITQEQAEAVIQLQIEGGLLTEYIVVGKYFEAMGRGDCDYVELGADDLETLAEGGIGYCQLWTRKA